MNIVITTLRKNEYKESYEKLLHTIPNECKIITIYQDEDSDSYEKLDNGNYNVQLKRNIYEYGAWIGLQMLIDSNEISRDDWYLMIHDTCLFTQNTVPKCSFIMHVLSQTDIDMYFLLRGKFHNICIVRRDGISNIAKSFMEKEQMTKKEALELECKLINLESVCHSEFCIPSYLFPSENNRTPVFLHSIDMFKFFTTT